MERIERGWPQERLNFPFLAKKTPKRSERYKKIRESVSCGPIEQKKEHKGGLLAETGKQDDGKACTEKTMGLF